MIVLLRILELRARAGLRAFRDHAFTILVLGPIVLGGVFWSLERWVEAGREALRVLLSDAPLSVGRVLALAVTLLFTELARRELQPRGEPWLAVLPVAEGVRWLQALVVLLARGILPALMLSAATALLASSFAVGVRQLGLFWWALLPSISWALLLAALRTRWRTGSLASGAVVVALLGTAGSSGRIADVLWAPWHPGAARLGGLLAAGAGSAPPDAGWGDSLTFWVVAMLAPGVLAASIHLRWGRQDLERAGGRVREARRPRQRVPSSGLRRLSPALVARDLRLVVRGYSAQVPAAAGVAGAILLPLASPEVRSSSVTAGILALASAMVLCSLVPGLVAREEEATWNDRTLGVDERDRLRAKLGVGGVLSIGPAAIAGAAVLSSQGPGASLLVVLASIVGASTMTAASFELPDDPGLAIAWGALLGGALALLILLVPAAWWMWTGLWLFVLSQLAERGARRLSRPRELR